MAGSPRARRALLKAETARWPKTFTTAVRVLQGAEGGVGLCAGRGDTRELSAGADRGGMPAGGRRLRPSPG